MVANYSPDGVLGLEAEEEALSEGLDIVHTEEVIRRHIRCQVSCTHHQLLQIICCSVLNSRLAYTGKWALLKHIAIACIIKGDINFDGHMNIMIL